MCLSPQFACLESFHWVTVNRSVQTTRYPSLHIRHLLAFLVSVCRAPARPRPRWLFTASACVFHGGLTPKAKGGGSFLSSSPPPPAPGSPEEASPAVVLCPCIHMAYYSLDHLVHYGDCLFLIFHIIWAANGQSCHNDDKDDKPLPSAPHPGPPFV